MTATEWLFKELWECDKDKLTWHSILEKAKEIEKQQMQDFGARCCLMTKQKNEWTLEQLYNETYGSKGSDETNGNNVEEVPNVLDDAFNQELFNYFSQEFNINLLGTEMHDIIDIVKRHTSSQTEISDEEIKAFAMGYYDNNGADYYVELGTKWYREQLKKK